MNYDNMLLFVKEHLTETGAIKPIKINQCFRDRYEHTVRVFKWMERIIDDFPECNKEIAFTSAIFHDIGYCNGQDNHAENGVQYFLEYCKGKVFSKKFIDAVCENIANHSNKELLYNEETSQELILLLEADLLDEEGVLGIAWDLLSAGVENVKSYAAGLEALEKHSSHILNQNYMVTPKAKEYWERKKKLVCDFIKEYESDLFLEKEEETQYEFKEIF